MRRVPVLFLFVALLAGHAANECAAGDVPPAIQAQIDLDEWLGRPVQDRFPDNLSLDSPNAAARYLLLLSCLDLRTAGGFGWLTSDSERFEVSENANVTVAQLRADAENLRLWVDEFVAAASLDDCRWHFAPERWARLLPPDDPRRGVLTACRRTDELLFGASRMALADGDVERAMALSLAQLRFAKHRLKWGNSDSIYVMSAFAGARKGAAYAARLATVIASREGKSGVAARFATDAGRIVRDCLADHRGQLRNAILGQAREKIEVLTEWASEDPPDERFQVVLLATDAAIRVGRSFVQAFVQKGLGADAARLLAWAPLPEDDRVPFRSILCIEDAQEAIAQGRNAIQRVDAAWGRDDWKNRLDEIDLEADEDATRVLSFLFVGVRLQAQQERQFQSEVALAAEELDAISNR